ncbi:helix-turn-helix domain-containing protein [Agromyces sp. SYSU K20354]|uniref:helix-turn-helix domain-containing protein n=1 Tax=Agromyces cavernae TaxID=2898659 RepID=UPI001E5C9F2D|nr:helix-turn-helix transcriptional regulator [Agromyces cavernae]MCD2441786.1 helix-turn-helix domain-containing protein [Agromyces cavernae]
MVMRVRRAGDLSQRQLASAVGLSQSQIARIESASRQVDVVTFVAMLSLAGMRLVVVDRDGVEVDPVSTDVLRDHGGRKLPAHLDVRPTWDPPATALVDGYRHRPAPKAWYHHRQQRDRRRGELGIDASVDQPTRRDIAGAEQVARATRLAEASRRAHALLAGDCACTAACWEHAGCAPNCECGCEA